MDTMQESSFHIVLVAPEIPTNTGNIGRICANTNATLHLIEPLGFSLDEKRLRRAGLDYWRQLGVRVHPSWEAFEADQKPERMWLATTKCARTIYEAQYQKGDYLIFGNETSGLPGIFYERYAERLVTIPMMGPLARSHNLCNAVSVVLYEGLRQTYFS